MAPGSYVRSHIVSPSMTLMLPGHISSVEDVCHFLAQTHGCAESSIRLTCEGRPLYQLPAEDFALVACLRLPGGKGGFGSMLRAIGAQIEKTTNKEACRDLSGRRLRDINQEKRLKEQLEKRANKERERLANRKKKFEKLKEEPKHIFNDNSFYKEQDEINKRLFDAVDKGFEVAAHVEDCAPSTSSGCSSGSDSNDQAAGITSSHDGQGTKRKADDNKKGIKKGRFADDLDDSSDDSDEE